MVKDMYTIMCVVDPNLFGDQSYYRLGLELL